MCRRVAFVDSLVFAAHHIVNIEYGYTGLHTEHRPAVRNELGPLVAIDTSTFIDFDVEGEPGPLCPLAKADGDVVLLLRSTTHVGRKLATPITDIDAPFMIWFRQFLTQSN